MNERKIKLEALLNFNLPSEQLKAELNVFSWDSATELVFLSVQHISNILNKFLNNHLTAIEVENWANMIESRDDIGFESADEQLLRQLIHELANPLLTEPLTCKRAIEINQKISMR